MEAYTLGFILICLLILASGLGVLALSLYGALTTVKSECETAKAVAQNLRRESLHRLEGELPLLFPWDTAAEYQEMVLDVPESAPGLRLYSGYNGALDLTLDGLTLTEALGYLEQGEVLVRQRLEMDGDDEA